MKYLRIIIEIEHNFELNKNQVNGSEILLNIAIGRE